MKVAGVIHKATESGCSIALIRFTFDTVNLPIRGNPADLISRFAVPIKPVLTTKPSQCWVACMINTESNVCFKCR